MTNRVFLLINIHPQIDQKDVVSQLLLMDRLVFLLPWLVTGRFHPGPSLFCPVGAGLGLCARSAPALCVSLQPRPHLSFTAHWFLLQAELLEGGDVHSSFLLYLFPQAEGWVQMSSSCARGQTHVRQVRL